MDNFDLKKYLAEGKIFEEEKSQVIAKEIVDIIMVNQNESGEFDYDEVVEEISQLLKQNIK